MARFYVQDGDEVFERVRLHASHASRIDFRDRLDELLDDPYPGDGDVYPYKGDEAEPDIYTASFGDGMIVYQVIEAPPVRIVRLWDVFLY